MKHPTILQRWRSQAEALRNTNCGIYHNIVLPQRIDYLDTSDTTVCLNSKDETIPDIRRCGGDAAAVIRVCTPGSARA